MAKNDLQLNVGTNYDGEGLKKLDTALKSSAKSINSVKDTVGKLDGELSKMGGNAGKVANAVSGLFSAFMQGGGVALAVAGISAAIGLVIKAFNDAKEKAKELGQAVRDSIGREVDAIAARFNGIFTRRDSANKNTTTAYGISAQKTKAD